MISCTNLPKAYNVECNSRCRDGGVDSPWRQRNRMDWKIESTSVAILGAGFSAAATDGNLPLMTGYFDRLHRSEFPDLFEFVTEVGCNKTCERIELANVERVLLALDQIRTSPEAL